MADEINTLRIRNLTAVDSATLPANAVGDTQVTAASPLGVTKTRKQISRVYGQLHGTAATAARVPIHLARGAGTVLAVRAGNVVTATGDSTATVDVRKNGTTILTGTIAFSAGTPAANAVLSGTLVASPTYVTSDIFEAVITVTAGSGTLPQAMFVELVLDEVPG